MTYAEDILRLLGRFGVATPEQIARHTGRRSTAVDRARQALAAQGLVRPIAVVQQQVGMTALALTTTGMHRLPALMPKQRVSLRHMDILLVAVELAWRVETEGLGRWMTWSEAVRGGRVLSGADEAAAAEGLILPDGDGRGIPVCIVLARPRRRAWRQRLVSAARAAAASEVRVYAAPHLCGELVQLADGLRATVIPWTPTVAAGPRVVSTAAGPPLRRRDALTPKRLRALRFLGRFGHATVDQVAAEQGTHSTAASIMLAAMEKLGLVQRHRQHHLHKDVYSATDLGISAAGLDVVPAPRVPPQRRHALGLVDLARHLCTETGGEWLTGREAAPIYARRRHLSRVGVPDGILCLADGRRIAIELELSSQARHAVLAFAAEQLAAGDCQEVWYVVTPEWFRRYAARLQDTPGVAVRAWQPPDRLGGPRGFRADRPTREPAAPRILGRPRRGGRMAEPEGVTP